ncbi:MAG: PhoH family protein, partial [Rhodobacteraceae bacterium]|nr:PhoH family protein [Paracoccaceae bacterium]
MGFSAITPPPRSQDAHETLLEFPDNRLLIDLCGEFDRNLAQIEHKLSVHILRRGNQLAVVGTPEAQAQASAVLTQLYARLEQGRPVDAAEIDAVIRMGDLGGDVVPLDEQLEMFAAGRYEIRTRKKQIEPRTEAQKHYVKHLFEHELAFGIGPAGTGK